MAREALVSKPPWLRGNIVILKLLLLLSGVCASFASSASNGTLQKSTCNQRDCLRCDLETAECVKCLYVMMADSRLCRSNCPPGYSTTWAPHPQEGAHVPRNAIMGRICSEQSMLALVSGRDVGIIAGAAVAGAVCVGVVIGSLLYMRRRTKPPPDHNRHDYYRHAPLRLWRDKRPKATEVPVKDEERTEFLGQLRSLRGEADNFLEMLSETRNRFRRLGGPDSATDTKAKAYRAVVRDLSRVLTLLNRKEDHIVTVPGDWRRLLSWASRVLTRYKRQKAAKEAGDIPSLEPLATGGGTLYQTRRQAQAERCRLVALGAPCTTLSSGSLSSIGMSSSPRGTDGPPTPCRETPPVSRISSRSTSMVSLSPVIPEEDDEDAPENPEDILFDETLETTPPSLKKSENQDTKPFAYQNNVKHDPVVDDSSNKGIFVVDVKEKNDSPSVHLSSVNCKKGEKLKSSYLEAELEKRGIPIISQDELMRGFKYVKETNNNITKKMNDINDLYTAINDGYITTPSVLESLKNLKNMGHLRDDTKSIPSPYLKMDGKLQQQQYENHKFAHDIHEKEKEMERDCSKVQISPSHQRSERGQSNTLTDTKRDTSDSLKCVKTDVKTTNNEDQQDGDKVKATLPGADVYLNIIRTPVTTGIRLSGDPYRDDTIEGCQDIKNRTIATAKSNITSPVSCKAEVNRHLSIPRCELTTEL